MKLLYGKPIADEIISRLKNDIATLSEKPGLAVVLIGDNKASQLYVSLKRKKAEEIGMNFFLFNLPEIVGENQIIELLQRLNGDKKVNGIIVQLPLPEGLDSEKIIESIDFSKDVDGFSGKNIEAFLKGESGIYPVFPNAIMKLIESSEEALGGKKAVVVVNSNKFGNVMKMALEKKDINAEYLLVKEVQDNKNIIKNYDIVISAVGRPNFITREMIKPGCMVIDGGIEKIDEKVFGDVDFDSVQSLEGFLTPVPGGVGPVTIACLLENVYLEFKAQQSQIAKD